jgi:hypothetical protein
VRQQVVKLQQQLADLQSSFDEEQRKAIRVILSHHLILALTSLTCFSVAAGWSEPQANTLGRFRVLFGHDSLLTNPFLQPSASLSFITSDYNLQGMFRLQILFLASIAMLLYGMACMGFWLTTDLKSDLGLQGAERKGRHDTQKCVCCMQLEGQLVKASSKREVLDGQVAGLRCSLKSAEQHKQEAEAHVTR